ncbi:MAG TPA: HPF/RaiA family ribosome-associated protein [Candidatus Acidoferrales bacterium]|nr:HPF/RaiA family ribosome-associated protein [Candidatus Acidoferrales bacterium]
MKLPLQITFRNVKSSKIVEEWVQAEAAKLDTFYDRIMSCRVAIGIPHRHHKRGDQYHIRIDLTLPGKEIVVKRKPSLRSRARIVGKTEVPKHLELETPHKQLRLAINDAFQSAGRRLQDYARRQRGDVKTHEPLPVARVSKLLLDEGYGFLSAADGREIYFHQDSVLHRGFHRLKVGTPVSYVEEQGEKGPQASTVRILRAGEAYRAA